MPFRRMRFLSSKNIRSESSTAPLPLPLSRRRSLKRLYEKQAWIWIVKGGRKDRLCTSKCRWWDTKRNKGLARHGSPNQTMSHISQNQRKRPLEWSNFRKLSFVLDFICYCITIDIIGCNWIELNFRRLKRGLIKV